MATIKVFKSNNLPGYVYLVDGKCGPKRGVSYTDRQAARDAGKRHAYELEDAKRFANPAEEGCCRELRLRIDEQSFYLKVLPMMVGKEFDVARGYGHAKYEITGMIGAPGEMWLFELDELCNPILSGGNLYPSVQQFRVQAVRKGGYNGLPRTSLGMLIVKAAEAAFGASKE